MYWISNIKNPGEKIIRKATNFSGSYLNLYPWPVASTVTRVFIQDPLKTGDSAPMATGPTLGTTVAALTNINFNPVRVALDNYNAEGQYQNQDGVYVLNPSNVPYLRIYFGDDPIGPTDVYVEGFTSSTSYKTIIDERRELKYGRGSSPTRNMRVVTGNTTQITSDHLKNDTPLAFREVSTTAGSGELFTFSGTLVAYIAADVPFSRLQLNLGSEGYNRKQIWTVQYWDGSSWGAVSGVASTTSRYGDSEVVLHQSGVITFTEPSDWARSTVTGDPYTNFINDHSGSVGSYATNYTHSDNQYWLRIIPAGGTSTDTIPVESISVFE
jgi:hypothetical protein